MKKIFLLAKDNLEIGVEEVLSLTKADSHELHDNVLIVDTEEKLHNRLAFTKQILELIFVCETSEVKKVIEDTDWNKYYSESFRVHVIGDANAKDYADIIWDKLKDPKVDLKYGKTTFEFFIIGDKIICGLIDRVIQKEFLKRKSHLLPESHPTAMHPKLAKALVNISGAETGDSILDPFCGAGGILIEAGIMRFKTHGWDIDNIMLKRAQKNLEALTVRRFHLENRNALGIDKKFDVVITDLPYGRNSKKTDDLEELYSKFLKKYYEYINRKMVVVFPDFIDYKKIIKSSEWKILKEFSSYLHKSLTRKIVVLGK